MKNQIVRLWALRALQFRDAGFLVLSLAALCGVTFSATGQTRPPPTNFNAFLPIYQVTQAGATGPQGTNLAGSLNILASEVKFGSGAVSYVNSGGYLFFPTNYYTNPPLQIFALETNTSNQFPQIPINPEIIDFAALNNLTVISDSAAINSAGSALKNAGLTPQYGTPLVDHAMFTAIYTNPTGSVISNTIPLDTAVEYQFKEPNGYPIAGPGEQVQLSYGSNGVVTRLLYSACQLEENPNKIVQLMSGTEASNLVASLYPPGAQINMKVVYWCPSFSPTPQCPTCEPPAWHPTNIIPWYYCSATIDGPGPAGAVETISLMTRIIPATLDTNYVPAPILQLSSQGSNVTATVSVTGGTPPYTYLWGGSDPAISSNTGPSITYTPTVRVGVPGMVIVVSNDSTVVSWPNLPAGWALQSIPNLGSSFSWTSVTDAISSNVNMSSVVIKATDVNRFFRLALTNRTVPVNETVSVSVTDANGVQIPAVQTIGAEAVPVQRSLQTSAINYGCESPYDPGLGSMDRANWLTGMSSPGGGSQRFCWTGSAAWPGDFIEPAMPGALGIGPWVTGDADFDNWGVNSASIVLYVGHGSLNAISFTIFGNGQTIESCGDDTPQSVLFEPDYQVLNGPAVSLNGICGGDSVGYSVPNYLDSWSNGGPTANDNLFWLCLLSCDVLQEYDSNYVGAWTRWGFAFNGLHILTGFDSNAEAETGFPLEYADNMLQSSETIVQAWLSAAHTKVTGTAAAFGPIGPNGIWDYNDHYWGKGSVGVSIPANEIQGWWHIMWPWTAPVSFP